jgi:hypothetical protein
MWIKAGSQQGERKYKRNLDKVSVTEREETQANVNLSTMRAAQHKSINWVFMLMSTYDHVININFVNDRVAHPASYLV